MSADNWFEHWFDSPYYHILYDHRDEKEAALFIKNIYEELELKPGMKVLDLACGAGRHAKVMNELGLNAIGVDLSENSIATAKKMENPTLNFAVHDMREPLPFQDLDVVFNLFTSFGYFNSKSENLMVLNSAYNALKPGGRMLIDFFNIEVVVAYLIPQENQTKQGIEFNIQRELGEDAIVKRIQFNDKGKAYQFIERVQVLGLNDFANLFVQAGFNLVDVYGDYQLNSFEPKESKRLIMLIEKD